jgi:hypothetical protein
VGRVLGLAAVAGIAAGLVAYGLPWAPRYVTRGVLAAAVVALTVVVAHLWRVARDRDRRLERIEGILSARVHPKG